MSTSTLPSISPASPPLPQQEAPRPSSRASRKELSQQTSKSRTRQFFSSVSRSRSRPGTPDLTSGLGEELPRRSQSYDAMTSLTNLEKLPSMASEISLRPATRESNYPYSEWRNGHSQSNIARSLFHKSSRFLQKRKSSNRLRTQSDLHDESNSSFDDLKDSYGGSRSKGHFRGFSNMPEMLKQSISDPYNFQHVTHHSSDHAKSLQTTNQRDLVSEYSAIRASQAPKAELKGIKAEPFPALSPMASPPTTGQGFSTSCNTSRATTPPQSRGTSRPTTPSENSNQASTTDRPSLRTSKSVDSFTRLASRSFSSPMPPISPPPRRSSRKPMALSSMLVIDPNATRPATSVTEARSPPPISSKSSHFGSPVLSSPAEQADVETNASPQEEIAQAVTTPDDSACIVLAKPPPTPLSALEDVPEEEETAGKEAADSRQIRHSKSMPSTRHFSRCFVPGVCNEATASDPTLPLLDDGTEDIPTVMHRRTSHRISNGKGIMESWEDGVDYCYEHALDDELYDWEGEIEALCMGSQQSTPQGNTIEEDPYSSIPSLHAESTKSVASSSVTVPGIVTPSEPEPSPHVLTVPRDSNGSTAFTLSPSLLIPREYSSRVTHEESYLQKLGDEPDYKSNYTFYSNFDPEAHRSYSPRSSGGTPITKSSSRDSLNVSRSGSINMRATTHRTSSSIGSIPELIGGKSSSRERLDKFTTNEGLNVDGLRQDLIKAAAEVPREVLEEASRPGTPNKITGRSRANSGAEKLLADFPAPATQAPTAPLVKLHQHRMRSASVANSMGASQRPKGHRTSYSLFPQTNAR